MPLKTGLHEPFIAEASTTRSPWLVVASTAALGTFTSILGTDLVVSVLLLQDSNRTTSPFVLLAVTSSSSIAFTALSLCLTAQSRWATEHVDPEDLGHVIAIGGAVGVGIAWVVLHVFVGFDVMYAIVFWCLFGFGMLLLRCSSSRNPDDNDERDDDERKEGVPLIV